MDKNVLVNSKSVDVAKRSIVIRIIIMIGGSVSK